MAMRTRKKGFTLIELLVVIAIIALLLSIVMPALGKAKNYAQRVVCSNGLRQQALGTTLYSAENDSYVPSPLAYTYSGSGSTMTVSPIGAWFWDVSFWFTRELSESAGFDDHKVFTCAGNKMRKPNDARWWQFTLSTASSSPVAIRDESGMSSREMKSNYRVLPYVYFFDKYVKEFDNGISVYDSKSKIGSITKTTVSGVPMTQLVIRKLSETKAAGSKPMIMDAVISNNNDYQFTGIAVGGLWGLSEQTLTDDTNHMTNQRVNVGTNSGLKPAGANIAFADGHAEWKNMGNYQSSGVYTVIQNNYRYGMWFWW